MRAVVDRYVPLADPMTQRVIDQIAVELEFSDDALQDLERTYENLRRRADLLIEHKVAGPEAFELG